MEAKAYTAEGEERPETVRLPESVFDGTVNEDVLHQVVTAIQAQGRQGTHSTKTRQAARGGGRKPWRQKGTGRARAGSIRSPLWRGGAVTFGPQPRDYGPAVPKKIRRLAVRSALNARAREGALVIVEPLELEEPRTKSVVELLEAIGEVVEGSGGNVLFLTDGMKRTVYLSVRNIPDVQVKPWGQFSAYDVLWADLVLVESSALDGLGAEEAGENESGADEVEGGGS